MDVDYAGALTTQSLIQLRTLSWAIGHLDLLYGDRSFSFSGLLPLHLLINRLGTASDIREEANTRFYVRQDGLFAKLTNLFEKPQPPPFLLARIKPVAECLTFKRVANPIEELESLERPGFGVSLTYLPLTAGLPDVANLI